MQNLHISLHMACVAERSNAGLRCALVETHLKIKFSLVGTQLRFGECTFVLVGHFGSQSWSIVLWVLLCLNKCTFDGIRNWSLKV